MHKIVAALLIALILPVSAEEVAPGVLRTSDAQFENLSGYPFQPNYMQINGLRVHYLDEGPRDGAPVFLLHGEPTWSYLFRTMIPTLVAEGHRVIAPDMIGFGRSDKLVDRNAYSYLMHVDMMSQLVTNLDLVDATFFGQDWGGLVGLRVVAAQPDRFARVVVSNTGLPAAEGIAARVAPLVFRFLAWWQGETTIEELIEKGSFPAWVAYSYYGEDMAVGKVMEFLGGIEDRDVIRGYEAPFPEARYKAGAQIFPSLIPTQLTENEAAWKNVFEKWEKPFLVAFTDEDPVTSGTDMAQQFEERVPGATAVTIKGVGHFVQEEVGPQLAQLMNDFIAGRPVAGFSKAAD